jgi:hypothetical protein
LALWKGVKRGNMEISEGIFFLSNKAAQRKRCLFMFHVPCSVNGGIFQKTKRLWVSGSITVTKKDITAEILWDTEN